MTDEAGPVRKGDWMAEAIAAFKLTKTRYSLFPSMLYLDRVQQGDGYTPPEPVPLSFYHCLRCRKHGGVCWLGSDFDADEDGYVAYPNVNILEEMVDLMTTARTYEANASVIEVTDTMATNALDIGR